MRLSLSYLVRVVRVDYPGQPEVSNLEQQLVCVDEYVGRLQVSVQDVSRVDELQSPQQLVEQQSSVTCSRTRDRCHDTPHCFFSHSCNRLTLLERIHFRGIWQNLLLFGILI